MAPVTLDSSQAGLSIADVMVALYFLWMQRLQTLTFDSDILLVVPIRNLAISCFETFYILGDCSVISQSPAHSQLSVNSAENESQLLV